MKNLLKYFEQYAEWMALGLGALFVLYVVYSYVLTPPVKITAGPNVVTPGTVDQITADGPAEQLQRAMNQQDVPIIKVEQFSERFKQAIQGAGEMEVTLGNVFNAPTVGQMEGSGSGTTIVEGGTKPGVVNELPVPPKAIPVGNSTGLSMVTKPNLNGVVIGADAKTIPVGQPEDVEWVSAFFKIPYKELQAAFQKSNIPAALSRTSILEVQLIRQEMQPDGSWGAEEVIEPLPTQVIPPYPQGNDLTEQIKYRDWAEKNASTIIEPGFYQVLGGDAWHKYDQTIEAPAVPVPQPKIEPVKKPETPKRAPAPAKHPSRTPPPAQKKSNPTPQPGGGGHRPYGAPKDPGPGAAPPAGNRPPVARPPGAGNDPKFTPPGALGVLPPALINPNNPRAQQPAQQPKDVGAPITGSFDPSGLQEDILIWAHDDSVEANKTYRYKIRYRIRNPVFQTRNVAKNQDLSNAFSIQSKEDSDWSDPVKIKPRTNFWLVRGVFGNKVTFEVFMWKEGKQTSKTFDVSPGDVIGGDSEFDTGWTVVDFRDDSVLPDKAVILVDENGNLLKRNYSRDQNDAEYEKLKNQVKEAGPPQANAGH